MRTFQQLLAGFLLERIPRRRNLSPNTAKGCRDSLALLLEWLAAVGGISPDAIGIGDLGRERIEALCAWLGDVRGSAPATVDVRLSALRSFAGHVSLAEPAHIEWASGIREIRLSKAPSREVGFLGADAVAVMIGSAAGDARGHALLSLLYDSGARASETSAAVRSDMRLKSPAAIRLTGKGARVRIVPPCSQVAEIVGRHMDRYAGDPEEPPSENRFGKPVGRAGMAWTLSRHADAARERDPELVPAGAHPHTLRHSKAAHLLESGVNLVYIRDFLGHSSVTATEMYARASTKARREAIEEAAANVIPESAYTKEEKSKLIAWLKDLM